MDRVKNNGEDEGEWPMETLEVFHRCTMCVILIFFHMFYFLLSNILGPICRIHVIKGQGVHELHHIQLW